MRRRARRPHGGANASRSWSGGMLSRESPSSTRSRLSGLAFALALALVGVPAASAAAPGVSAAVWPTAPDLQAPTLTLEPPPPRTRDTQPSFSGAASDVTTVTVDVYAGGDVRGEPVASARALPSGGAWASPGVSPALADGTYTAVASQPSSLGGPPGVSAPVSFEVDTKPPTVTLDQPRSPSKDETPSFSGSASEATQVIVEVFGGDRAEGPLVATARATPATGRWSSSETTPPLPDGSYTAVASQASELGNEAGESAPVIFIVDTHPPTVTLEPVASPSRDATPSFSGSATEATNVTVDIYAGGVVEGPPVASVTATGGGEWVTAEVSPALADGTYIAIASQPSAIGNPTGCSAPVPFIVDTHPPTVTLERPASPSADRSPAFSGSASDDTPVSVELYSGASITGVAVTSVSAQPHAGHWSTPALAAPLEPGEYTAVATQESSLGNAPGLSAPATFVVQSVAPVAITEAAGALGRASAAMYGSVEPKGAPIEACYFEYGTSLSYGKRVGCALVSGAAAFPAEGLAPVGVFARVYGLDAASIYHFRLVMIGEGGAAYGADEAFTTLPPWLFEEGSALAAGDVLGASATRLEPLIATQLARYERTVHVVLLLRRGMFKALFRAPTAGKATIEWLYLARRRRRRGRSSPSARARVRVASGSRTFHLAGSETLEVRLTGAGRRLLRARSRVTLTATCVFVPAAGTAVRSSRTFSLGR
jgi:Bacterial Ig-like domain